MALGYIALADRSGQGRREAVKRFEEAWEAGSPSALPGLLAADPNLYALALQTALRSEGLYSGDMNGLMTKRTLSAINAYCRHSELDQLCRQGPLTTEVGKALGRALLRPKQLTAEALALSEGEARQ